MRRLFVGCALIGLTVAAPALATIKDGVDAWLAGDYAKAVSEWRGPAAAGDPDAQYNLGQAYKLGRGVPVDINVAIDWYRKAAAAGHEQAQSALGAQLFQSGKRDEAMIWLKKAADQGEAVPQYIVGTAYFNGDYTLPKDWPRAYAMMTRAKAAGIGPATASLAQMEQIIPDQQRQVGLALAREMERTAKLRADDTPPGTTALTTRTARTPQPVGQTGVPASTPPAAPSTGQASSPTTKSPPATSATKSAATAPAKIAVAAPAKPAPAPAKPIVATAGGGWKIQLGAFSSPDGAKTAWKTLSGKVPALKALSPTYVAAGAFTRLQAGPLGSRAAADQACAAVKTTGGGCFQVAP